MMLSIETGGDLQPPLKTKTWTGELVGIEQVKPEVFVISLQTTTQPEPVTFALGPHLRITEVTR